MKGTSTVFLAVLATALVAVAKPSHSIIAGLLRQSRSDLHARSGINPSSISTPCQPSCTTIIKKLDACTSAACECTQANFAALGVCINCLIALGPDFSAEVISPGSTYVDTFRSGCDASGIQLDNIPITATATGIASTGDPLSPFEVPTPTSGATAAVTYALPPLIPTPAGVKAKIGSAIGLNAFRALGTSVVVATVATIVMLGVSSL